MIVVDTSVLVDFFRGRETPAVAYLVALEESGEPYAIPTLCCQELLQGARDEVEWELLQETLQTQHRLHPVDPWATHMQAARLYFECRRRGVTIRSTIDCLVAQLVIEVDGTLLHSDQDFVRLASVHPLRLWAG